MRSSLSYAPTVGGFCSGAKKRLSKSHPLTAFPCLTPQNDLGHFWGRGDRGSGKTERNITRNSLPMNHNLSQLTTGLEWGKAELGWCGLGQTGRTLSTYQGSGDTIHSVFLVLFWLGMDLEKQKDGATDMHCLKLLRVK